MRHARNVRGGLAALRTGWGRAAGCIQNYSPVPVCGPSAPYGAVCDVPAPVVEGGTVAQGPTRSAVVGAPPAPPVVVSEPSGRARLPGRRADPDSGLATTRVEGAIDGPPVTR